MYPSSESHGRVGTQKREDNLFHIPAKGQMEVEDREQIVKHIAKDEAERKKQRTLKLRKRALERILMEEKEKKARGRGVIYIGHIPHGFYKEQQYQFFSQYGKVTRLRLARNRKTGAYKGYGWVEFDDAAVAHEMAEKFNKYNVHGKSLHIHVVPNDQVHPELFRNCERDFVKVNTPQRIRQRESRSKTLIQKIKALKRQLQKAALAQRQLLRRISKKSADNILFKSQKEEGEAFISDIKQQILDLSRRRSKLRVKHGLEDGLVTLGRMFRIYGREIRST
uniref:RRM domain-containing protein n=1 Tax=Guillardia theta TaxID=55529 RepID=A0A7S4NN50_GUITH